MAVQCDDKAPQSAAHLQLYECLKVALRSRTFTAYGWDRLMQQKQVTSRSPTKDMNMLMTKMINYA